MWGINVPVFKILDVLSVEFEWFGSPYPPSFDYASRYGWPQPVADKSQVITSPLKWSVYARKTLGAWTFSAQAAKDHMKPFMNNLQLTERTDVLPSNGHWWWIARIACGF
jgi:hypothetical protein